WDVRRRASSQDGKARLGVLARREPHGQLVRRAPSPSESPGDERAHLSERSFDSALFASCLGNSLGAPLDPCRAARRADRSALVRESASSIPYLHLTTPLRLCLKARRTCI